ncbi:hypothetical protein RHSIM_Rhsim10G0214800 [Rhododendron simsii]|uniref:Morc S5 domain-containing protein n=1 Tax=Rhododendron simsii TaxID=118357 RepID=A0A834GCN5_RHOSS|nr:hypothetical protein RHSIM_Rhsim10G0214800 [Rhododendron simsii]
MLAGGQEYSPEVGEVRSGLVEGWQYSANANAGCITFNFKRLEEVRKTHDLSISHLRLDNLKGARGGTGVKAVELRASWSGRLANSLAESSTYLVERVDMLVFGCKDLIELENKDMNLMGTRHLSLTLIEEKLCTGWDVKHVAIPIGGMVLVETTIGFIKEAPALGVNGFNVYHKNRLIRPFWKVTSDGNSQGNGVVGVLEANFMEPAHDKQDFERSSLFIRLEMRLKQMVAEYWRGHCHLIGHKPYNSNRSRIHVQSPVGHMANVQKQLPIGDHVIGLPGNVQNKTRQDHPIIGLPAELGQELTGTQPGDHCRTSFLNRMPAAQLIDLSAEPAQEVRSVDSITSTSIDQICEENIHLFMRCEEHVQKENELRKTIEALENQVEETKRKCAQLSAHLESRKKRKVMQQIEDV